MADEAPASNKRKLSTDGPEERCLATHSSFSWKHAIDENGKILDRNKMSDAQVECAQRNYEQGITQQCMHPQVLVPYCGPDSAWLVTKKKDL